MLKCRLTIRFLGFIGLSSVLIFLMYSNIFCAWIIPWPLAEFTDAPNAFTIAASGTRFFVIYLSVATFNAEDASSASALTLFCLIMCCKFCADCASGTGLVISGL